MKRIGFGARDIENRKHLHTHRYVHPKVRKRGWPLLSRVRAPVPMKNKTVTGKHSPETRACI